MCDDDVLQCRVPFGQSQHFTLWATSKDVWPAGPWGHFCPYEEAESFTPALGPPAQERHGKGPEKGYKDSRMAGAHLQAETVGTVQP